MSEVTVHQAKTHLSRLLRRVAAGEEIVITRSGDRVARLVAIEPPAPRRLGRDRGRFAIPDDFDDELPEEVLAEIPLLTADEKLGRYSVEILQAR